MTKKTLYSLAIGCCFGALQAQSLNTVKLDSLFDILAAKNKSMCSIAISENGKVIYTKAIGMADAATNTPATTATKYRIGSITKMFTTCLVFKAVEEQKITLEQTLDRYFPTVANAHKITISMMLNHRTGIHNFTDDAEYMDYHTQPKTQEAMVALLAAAKSEFEPDSKAEYSNSNFVLLSYILEKVYKKSYKELLESKITKPLGLKNTYFGGKTNIQNNECYSYSYDGKWVKEDETDMSIPMGAGAVVATPTDLTKFIEALFAGKIINDAHLQQMKTFRDHYGMGMFETPFYDKKGYGHTGGIDGFGSCLSYFPEDKLAIALTANGMVYENNNIMIGVLSTYYNKPFDIPTFTTIALKTEDLDPYLGEYASPQIPLTITITKQDTALFAQATGQSAFPLEAVGVNQFAFDQAHIKINFNPAEKQLTIDQGGMKFTMTKK